MVLLFPGQGSQHSGMGKYLVDQFGAIAKPVFEEASDAIGINLAKLCWEGSDADLALTENTQPTLVTVSIATLRVLESEYGISSVKAVAGHSVGEYSALVAAGAISFRDAVVATRLRGQAMQSAVPVGVGGMAAVLGLDAGQVQELCEIAVQKSGFGPLSAANFNSPGQIVISGHKKAIDWALGNKEWSTLFQRTPAPQRVKLIALAVSAPFHCAMMKPAEEKMIGVLNEITFHSARIPVLQNVHASLESKASILKDNLIAQICAPVLWEPSMRVILQNHWRMGIEVGCGKVLSGLWKKIDPENFRIFNTTQIDELIAAGNALAEYTGR